MNVLAERFKEVLVSSDYTNSINEFTIVPLEAPQLLRFVGSIVNNSWLINIFIWCRYWNYSDWKSDGLKPY